MKPTFFSCILLLFLTGCASTKSRTVQKHIGHQLTSSFFENQFTGFLLVDAITRDTLYNQNSHKYFTPASNTKIATLYTALELLPERLPALKYRTANDTTFVAGTGDPTFLHPYFQDSTALGFLKSQKHVALYLNNFKTDRFGSGWAWDDYQYYYQVEKSAFPIYGNIVRIFKRDSLNVTPRYFQDSVIELSYRNNRKEQRNLFFYDRTRKDTLEVPFRIDSSTTRKLIARATGKKISLAKAFPKGEKETLPGIPSDSVYRRMMVESDNFLAEQLLILASSTLSDTLDDAKSRRHMLENQLADLAQKPRWVDGSGLSRYNLFSPQSLVHILYRMYHKFPSERLLHFFPAGGVSGTLENWYAGETAPFLFAKSGSLGNNYCLSGYLKTKSGKILIFSFMNNHFMHPNGAVKKEMEKMLEKIRDGY